LAFPWDRRIWGSGLPAAQRTITRLVRTISVYEPVCLLVPPSEQKGLAKRVRSTEVEIVPAHYNDIWVRDTLPTFATRLDGTLVAIDWRFNGWGKTPGLPYSQDVRLARWIAQMTGADVVSAGVVAEGGAFTFDGHDTIVTTQSVMLHPLRNEMRSQSFIQEELLRACNCTSICWLPGDESEPITRGHADAIVAFANPTTVLFHWVEDEQGLEGKVCEQNLQAFRSWMDERNRRYDIVKLPSLPALDAQYCASYVNFAHVNGAIVMPVYGERFSKLDDRAKGIIGDVFSKRIETVLFRDIAAYGGGIHCCTQQQPLIESNGTR
jgi:agmatine deiminase